MSVSKHLCTLKPLDSNQVHKTDCYLEITIHFGLKNVKILCDDITVMVTQNLVYTDRPQISADRHNKLGCEL